MIALRLITNTGARMMFTFLPEFSRGTGLGVDQLGRLIAIRDLSGLIAPAVGRASDRRGTRRIMLIGGAAAGLGALLLPLGTAGLAVGLILFGLGRVAYQVSMNAWVGHEVAYERRGRASGQIEMTWAGAALIGLPTIGLLIDRVGWRAGPSALGILTLPLLLTLRHRLAETTTPTNGPSPRPALSAAGWFTLAAFTSLNGAVQFLVFAHGIWLEETYGFEPTQVGLAIVAVGLAELAASFSSSRITDRFGKRNSVAAGAAVLTVGLAALAIVDRPPLVVGVGLLVIAFLGFEFAIVSAIPLIAELDPLARAEVIGRSVGLSILARSGGSLAAAMIIGQGFRTVMAVATILAVITTALSLFFVEEPGPPRRTRAPSTPGR